MLPRLTLLCAFFASLLRAAGATNHIELPLWKSLLLNHRDWTGLFIFDGETHHCYMTVHSVEMQASGTVFVSLSTQNLKIDMDILSDDGYNVTFTETASWRRDGYFLRHEHIKVNGAFRNSALYYKFIGNASSPTEDDFGIIRLTPKSRPVGKVPKKDHHMIYGLAVGIPVVLAIILMITGALILAWACRKGYLRHIPWAYKNFRNPRNSLSDVEMSDSTPTRSQEQVAVHM